MPSKKQTLHRLSHWFAFYSLIFVAGCTQRSVSLKEVCQQHQTIVWDAAGSYYLEHKMKPGDLIAPQELKDFFGPDGVPYCPLSTNAYAPFKFFDGPRCPHHHGVVPMSEKTIKIKQNTE